MQRFLHTSAYYLCTYTMNTWSFRFQRAVCEMPFKTKDKGYQRKTLIKINANSHFQCRLGPSTSDDDRVFF